MNHVFKKILPLLLLLCLFGCYANSIKKTSNIKDDLQVSEKEINFLQENGNVSILYDEANNQWISITATSNASIGFKNNKATLDAFSVATLRAKGLLVSFLAGNISSKQYHSNTSKFVLNDKEKSTTEGQTQPVQEVDIFGDAKVDRKYLSHDVLSDSVDNETKIVENITQEINENAQAILKGAFVIERKVDKESNLVSVTVSITRYSVEAAKQIKKQISLND